METNSPINSNQPLPTTNEIPSQRIGQPQNSKLVKILLYVVGAIVFMAIGAFGYGYFQNKKEINTTSMVNLPTQTPSIRQEQTTLSVQSTAVPTVSQLNWKPYKIDLYGLDLSIPNSWTVQEANRRPEPIIPGSLIKGHDCADYKIKSNDNTVVLSILPSCGFSDGGADSWPSDAFIVKDKGNNSWIIRYFDATKSSYVYSDAGQATIEDEKGTRLEKMHASPPIVSVKKDKDSIPMTLELKYTGTEANKFQQLQIVDTIVTSIK